MQMLELFKAARNAAAPLVAIQTPDPASTIQTIAKGLNGDVPPIFEWDTMRGVRAVTKEHKDAINCFRVPETLIKADEMLAAAQSMPEDSILFVHNAQRHLCDVVGMDTAPAIQAAWNLRDQFKESGRMVVLLAPTIKLPPELANDTVVLDEPLPDAEHLESIANDLYDADGAPKRPDKKTMVKIVDAVNGLAAFPAEQAMAMSLRKVGMDLNGLWERKRQMIEQTPGLSVWRGGNSFDAIGGLDNLKGFLRRYIGGKHRPRAIVFWDEIEKTINPEGDLSGVSRDQLGEMLKFMQDNDAAGIILVGPPGTGKSEIAKASGNEAEAVTMVTDMGGMKAGIVGESEHNIRAALKVCKAVGGDRLLFIATCNSIAQLPVELRRRFTLGTFFMDLPDAEEREVIWKIYAAKYHADLRKRPPDLGWTGAEIKQCCVLSDSLGISLMEASQYIVPVAKSAEDKIDALRTSASGRYISASKPGLYEKPMRLEPSTPPVSGKRKMNLQ